ncbi:MAG: radical SAM protein [Clostridia bacterium]|nr:radical SAM protein [Clostridia bacterium]
MKVLLIQPTGSSAYMDKIYMYEPLGLEYLGAGLKEDGHEVFLLDARIEPDTVSYDDIAGLAIPGETLKFTAHRPYTPLDDLPFPDRSLTAPYREHYFCDWMKPLASMRTSLGCVSRCNFCALWSITGGRYLTRKPEKILEELATIQEEYVFFCDDESMCHVARMDRLAELILASGIRKQYFLYARVDTVVKNPQLFAKWKRAGLAQVFVGFETYSDERLAKLNKNCTLQQQEQAIKILNELEIDIYGSFMVDPSFTKGEFEQFINYIRKLKISHAGLSILTPLPGTDLYRETEQRLLTKEPEFYDFMHTVLPTTLPLEDFYREYARALMKSAPWPRYFRFIMKFPFNRRLRTMKQYWEVLKYIREGYKRHVS